jgi:membrane associated rhomboid family serine protease
MGRREERAAKAAAQRQADAGRAGLLLTIGVVGAAVTIAVAVLSGGRIPVPGLGILGAISGWLLARGVRGLRARARA